MREDRDPEIGEPATRTEGLAWQFDARAIRRVHVFRDAQIDEGRWPANIPAVASFLQIAQGAGFEFGPGVTFLVGENGSGKSTLIEGIAEAAELPVEGGSTSGGRTTHSTESPLGSWLRIERGLQASKWGFFLRAETMHGYYTYLEELNGPGLHRLSHGESFNELLDTRLDPERGFPSLVCLDEPEAALSFQSALRWITALDRMRANGTQVICATHSPVLTALPGATILELGEWGIRSSQWEDLELVQQHRTYLAAPERYLRHLFDPDV